MLKLINRWLERHITEAANPEAENLSWLDRMDGLH